MKLAILLMLMAATSFSQVSRVEKCKDKNPFLRHWNQEEHDGIAVFKKPLKLSSHCLGEWNVHGTCCKPSEIVAFVKKDALAIDEAVKEVSRILKQQSQLFVSVYNLAREIRAKNLTLDTIAKPFLEKLANLNEYNMNFFHDILRPGSNFTSDMDRCWSHMKKIRSASVCSICSGRSESFFEGKRGIILPDTCSDTLEKCKQSFISMLGFVFRAWKIIGLGISKENCSTSGSAATFRKTFKKYNKQISELKDDRFLRQIWARFMIKNTTNLYKLFTSNKTQAQREHQDAVKALPKEEILKLADWSFCNKMVTLFHDSFVIYYFKRLKLDITGMEKIIWQMRKAIGNSKVPFSPPPRRLSQVSNWETPEQSWASEWASFTGDVVVDPQVQASTDSSYSSHIGAIGTSGNEACNKLPFMPINMTMLFP